MSSAPDGSPAERPRDAAIGRDGSQVDRGDAGETLDRDAGSDERLDAALDAGTDHATDAQTAMDGGDAGDGITPAEACAQLVAATCDWFLACRAPGADCMLAGPASVVAARCATTPAAVQDGRASFDPTALPACIQDVQDASSPCDGMPPPTLRALGFAQGSPTACSDVFVGRAKLGEDCYPAAAFGTDGCAEGYCVASTCPGVCTAYLAAGAACSGGGRCAPDAFCNGTCHTYLKQDEDCSDPLERCAGGLYCAADEHCKPLTALGAPCSSSDECGGFACAPEGQDGALVCFARAGEGVACHADVSCASETLCIDGHCTRQVATGQHCYRDSNCPSSDRCTRANPDDAIGSCEPRLGVGEPCTERGDDDCRAELYCSFDGTPSCAARVGVDESCAQARCLATLWCDPSTMKCRALSGEGGSCDREGPLGCVDGLSCMGDGLCHAQGAEPGDPCSGAFTQSCAAGLSCDRATQTCVMLPGENAACNHGEEPSCQPGLWCACDGQPCTGTFDPWTGNALERCLPKVALGESCVGWQQCGEGDCDSSGTCRNPPPPCTGL